ncbi:glycosyltransferase [Saxibacter everestensis]|uniref:Glycosyltransferase n=1 Tax=Saxibacter everestensis TaxID=2909229 RepID=A0ABY8QWR5_9MICO|nr:glycosyltransferase [Brevibacteriaceae bacterium ZFBP1038]
MRVLKVVLFSHDSVGLGHIRRNLALAHALSDSLPGLLGVHVSGLLVTGEAAATKFPAPAGWDWCVLPGIRKSSAGYRPRRLEMDMGNFTSLRSDLLTAVLLGFSPDLFVVDRHPTGVHGELENALTALRTEVPNCRTVLGLREILDSPGAVAPEWTAVGGPGRIKELFDRIWIYGDPAIHNPFATGEVPGELQGMADFTGYLAAGRAHVAGPPLLTGRYVMSMVGGGSDGRALAELAAQAEPPPGVGHLIVTGPQMTDEDRTAVEARAGERATVVQTVPDMISQIRHSKAVVSMGGYNSVCELMGTNVPALIVPRSSVRAEQRLRAEGLAAAGLVEHCRQRDLSPARLTEWFARNLDKRVLRGGLQLSGLRVAGELAAQLLDGSPPSARAYSAREVAESAAV